MMIPYFDIVFDALARIRPAAAAAMRSRRGRWTLALTVASATAAIPLEGSAACRRISSNIYASDDSGSSGGLPAVVNINRTAFQPDGTLLGSGIGSFLQMGYRGSYGPQDVLFRCQAADDGKLFEFYSTNGDNDWGGKTEADPKFGLQGAYYTWAKGMLIRVTNVKTGQYFSRYWKSRPMTGLDRDTNGDILVKAKDFSDVQVELLRADFKGANDDVGTYAYSQPAAYIAFKGPGLPTEGLRDGADHAAGNWHGFPDYWPGTVNLYNRLFIRRAATCSVTTVTPYVTFPTVTVARLNQGVQSTVPFNINFECQEGTPYGGVKTALVSGTGANQTAMGVLVAGANYRSAVAEGLSTSGGGVTFLLSDGYGVDPSMATGVGIALSSSSGTPMNFLSTDTVTGGGNVAGWYPVKDGAYTTWTGGYLGTVGYSKTLNATLKKLPGKRVTPGKVRATAQVVIRVQ
jgi:type 1 fimbria pilin